MVSDAYAPREIAQRVQSAGVAKGRSDALSLTVLAVLAGAFIALGALFYIVGGSLLVAGVYWLAYLRTEAMRDVGE